MRSSLTAVLVVSLIAAILWIPVGIEATEEEDTQSTGSRRRERPLLNRRDLMYFSSNHTDG